MDFFVHDSRVQLKPTGVPGPVLIPGPPYWFGAKGRIAALRLPREVPAKLVIPAGVPPGPVHWQAANANGCTAAGVFVVGSGTEVVEDEGRKTPQLLPSLPVTVSGRVLKIEETDRYRFVATRDGPVTCELTVRRLGSKFLAILEVRDGEGRLVADVAGTNGTDPASRSAVYRLAVRRTTSGFDLQLAAQRVSVPLGDKFDLAIKAVRKGGFKGPIALRFTAARPSPPRWSSSG